MIYHSFIVSFINDNQNLDLNGRTLRPNFFPVSLLFLFYLFYTYFILSIPFFR